MHGQGYVPTIEKLAIKLVVHRDTLYAWEKPVSDPSRG